MDSKRKNKEIVSDKTCLCKKCESQIFGLLNELKAEAVKQKRCTITLDTIGDLEVSLIEGTIRRVQQRDEAWKMGNGKSYGRRFHVKIE